MTLDKKTAEKILAADFTNIMKKVKSGKPLTPAERELVKQKTAEAAAAEGAGTPPAPSKKKGSKESNKNPIQAAPADLPKVTFKAAAIDAQKPEFLRENTVLNMDAAVARTKLSRTLVEAARNAGCKAFHPSGRVDCVYLVEYVAEHPELAPKESEESPNALIEDARLKRVNREIREEKLLEIRRKIIKKTEAGQRLYALGKRVRTIIETELKGRPKVIAKICGLMRDAVEEWKEL